MKKQILALLLASALWMGLLSVNSAWATETAPVSSNNINTQEYVNGRRWASTVRSYLYENSSGGLTRVEYINNQIIVEDYDDRFQLQSSRTVPTELTLWGGFFPGKDYHFLVFGQNNQEEDNGQEVIRIVKYSKDWERLDSVGLYGANTVQPFDAGSVRFAECNGYLYIHTSHKMYTNEKDGLNHQASVMINVRQSDMKITDSSYEVGGIAYTSHSFNQFILVDQQSNIIALDHGDAYPRAITLQKLIAKAGRDSMRESKRVPAERPGWYYTVYEDEVTLVAFPGSTGANDTGAAVGGFAETSNGYVTAYNFDGTASNLGKDPRDVYLAFTGKNLSDTTTVKLSSDTDTSVPVLAPTGPDGGYIMWNGRTGSSWYSTSLDDTLHYARYDANGKTDAVQTATAALSDCAPILWNGKAVWYVTNNSVPTFYTLDNSGVTAYTATVETDDPDETDNPDTPDVPDAPSIPETGTAYPSTQTVTIDGKQVEFQMYALKNADGNLTNYVKVRDLALALSGSEGQFSVDWDGAVNLTAGKNYTTNGSENSTPFSGERSYTLPASPTKVNGATSGLTAIFLVDDDGGGYTYYKLRDLGRELGFNVSYIDGQVVINTDEPYSDAQ